MPPFFTTFSKKAVSSVPVPFSGRSITWPSSMVSHMSRASSHWSRANSAPFRQPTEVPVITPGFHPSSRSALYTPT